MEAYYKNKTKEELEDLVNKSNTLSELMKSLGYSGNRGNSIKGLKKHLDSLGIDYSKYSNNPKMNSCPKYELSKLLVKDCNYSNHTRLKKRILLDGLLEQKCSICGISE